MRFGSDVFPYLHGDSFSNGLCLQIAASERSIQNRLTVLDSLAAGKRVVHVGCCDHVPLIQSKLAAGKWLHSRLCVVSERCFGVDTSEEGITLMRDVLGYRDVVVADIAQESIPELESAEWDYLILGELLEHLDDPVGFLSALRDRYKGNIARLIITVPNALSLLNARFALQNRECINTDHRHWFSPYTLGRMLISAGLHPEDFFFCEPFESAEPWYKMIMPRTMIVQFLLRRHPALREGLIMIARI